MSYLMGDDSGLGFVSVLWGQGKLVSESWNFFYLSQGSLSNFWEGDNFMTRIEKVVANG